MSAMHQTAKILMIEGSPSLTEVYKAYLADSDYQVVSVESLGIAYTTLGAFQPDIVLLDIELPDGNGMEFLARAGELDNPPKIIVMTDHGTSDMAVEAIRLGAIDFLTKPFDAARLKVTVDNAASQLQLGRRVNELASLQREHYGSFIGKSLAMQSVYKTIDSLAANDAITSHIERRQQIEPLWLTEKDAIESAIEVCDGNGNRATGFLEFSPSTIYRKIQTSEIGKRKARASLSCTV
jgi:DNA-binding NtrC family response regulator